jgi:L-arabinose transport system substrate-binding protein
MKTLPLILCSALAAASLALSACGPKTDPAKGSPEKSANPAAIKIGYLVKQPEEPWFQFEWKGAEKAAAEFGFELLKYGTPDGEKVMGAIDNLAVSGAQGFVICTPDVRLGPQIMARARQKNMKVMTVDDQFVKPDGSFMTDVHYIGMSASKIGESVGEALAAEMKRRNWNVEETGLCLVTFEELDTARERTEGVRRAIEAAGFPASRIFKAPQKTTDIPGSFDAAAVLLTRQGSIKRWLIAGMNDNAVLGAVRAMEGRGFGAGNVIGIGINGTDCIDELRKAKPTGFHGSMLVSAPAEGYESAKMLYHWIKDGTVPPVDTRTEGIFITRENFEQVLKKEGIL